MGRSRLHVALVGPLPPPAAGIANQTRQLAQLLEGEGIAVEVVRANSPWRSAWIGRVPVLRAVFRLPPYVAHLWRAFGRCDIVHLMANSGGAWFLWAVPAMVVARLRGAPVVVNYRGGGAERFLRRHAWAVRPVLAWASALCVPSEFLLQVFARFGIGAEVLPNVVDHARFAPADARPPAEAPHLIVTRNLEAIYDNATALRAFALVHAEFPAARLTIAGEGSELEALQSLTDELGLRSSLTFSGRIDNAQIPALYRSASVFINPSLVDNTPNSVLEALASGVPVVSTNVGGVPYLVEHEKTALLVPPGKADAMAAAILRLLRERALADALIVAGRETARRHDWANVRPRLLALYERSIGRAARAVRA